ncbi:hypothetical protein [Chromobacterium haemolyticum]|uniref:hypothetical protein n=1 Tax=Chromobacterium haemolyticum TaxID=394935 RepID=UPI00244D44DC|nr:hypothetical protein [Chromobacterium haemolyticum]MDH0342000.1 hypothetical protein [Chromobacterium haemolyticum]
MCFKRKPSLGRYNATRAEWGSAYRKARVELRAGIEPDPATCGVVWKAALIAHYERNEWNDPLTIPVLARLESARLIDEIVAG